MKTYIKYVLQSQFMGNPANSWQDDARDDRIDIIEKQYRISSVVGNQYHRSYRIVERTITESDEVVQ